MDFVKSRDNKAGGDHRRRKNTRLGVTAHTVLGLIEKQHYKMMCVEKELANKKLVCILCNEFYEVKCLSWKDVILIKKIFKQDRTPALLKERVNIFLFKSRNDFDVYVPLEMEYLCPLQKERKVFFRRLGDAIQNGGSQSCLGLLRLL